MADNKLPMLFPNNIEDALSIIYLQKPIFTNFSSKYYYI